MAMTFGTPIFIAGHHAVRSQLSGVLKNSAVQLRDHEGTDPVRYFNLQPVHFAYKLQTFRLLKFNETGSTSISMTLDLVVCDFQGNELRTVSATSIDALTLPNDLWTDISLVNNAGALVIDPTELVQLLITKAEGGNDTYSAYLAFSADGVTM